MLTTNRFLVVALLAAACGGSPSTSTTTTPATTGPATATTEPTPAMAEEQPVPPAAPPMPEKTMPEKIADNLQGLLAAWNQHDPAKIAAAYSEHGMMQSGPQEATGRAAIQAAAAEEFKVFPDFKVALTRVIANDNTRILEWVVTGTNTGDSEIMKIKATGRPIGLHGVDVVIFDDAGLIKENRRYVDAPTQMAQLNPKAKKGTFRAVATLPTGEPAMVSSAGSDDEAANLGIAKAMYQAIDDHKIAGILKGVDKGFVADDFSQPQPVKGVAQAKKYITSIFRSIPDVKQDVGIQFAAGDLVVTEGYMHGTFKRAMGPMKPTNKPIGMHFVDIMQVKGGKVVHISTYGNSMEMMTPAK